jgi:hypothetical protein
VDKKRANPVVAYLPAFSFTLAYFSYQYLLSGISITVPPVGTLRTLLVYFAILTILGFVAHKILKDHMMAGLTLWLVAELFLFSQYFFVFSGVIAVILVALWVGITLLRKKKVLLKHISFMLAVLGFGLAFGITIKWVQWEVAFKPAPERTEMTTPALTVPDAPPDIYYIVMDAYTHPRILDELYGFDNSDFTESLLERGFIIPEDNYSNYALTALSVGSALNMDYVQNLLPGAEGWMSWWLMAPLVRDSRVQTALEEAGYQSMVVASDWEITNNKNVELYLTPFPVRSNDFEKLFIQTSPLRLLSPFLGKFMPLNTYDSHRETIEFAFTTLSEIPAYDGPKFVFSHITAPHPPFVFDGEGNPITPTYDFAFVDGSSFHGTREEYKQGYIDQVKYVNRQLEQVIDSILENSKNPPIIILMADHGSRLLTDFRIPANTCIHEAYSNFAAFYLPGADGHIIPEDITPVNVFRIIFDEYFGAEFGLLENEYYFSSDGVHIYQFEDVTSRIHQQCEVSP